MQEFYIRRSIGEESLRISVDATKIRYEIRDFSTQNKRLRLRKLPYLPKQVRKILDRIVYETSNFKLSEAVVKRVPVNETPVFLKMKDVFENRKNLKASQTYEKIANRIEVHGFYKHKSYIVQSSNEIEDCIKACFLDILLSMDQFGYLENKKSDFATGGIGSAFIDRDGTILKSIGATHRFAAAKVVGLESLFPLRIIGTHADWLQSHGIRGARDMKTFARQLRLAELDNR
jgi:hypothetical protein